MSKTKPTELHELYLTIMKKLNPKGWSVLKKCSECKRSRYVKVWRPEDE